MVASKKKKKVRMRTSPLPQPLGLQRESRDRPCDRTRGGGFSGASRPQETQNWIRPLSWKGVAGDSLVSPVPWASTRSETEELNKTRNFCPTVQSASHLFISLSHFLDGQDEPQSPKRNSQVEGQRVLPGSRRAAHTHRAYQTRCVGNSLLPTLPPPPRAARVLRGQVSGLDRSCRPAGPRSRA